MGSRARKSTLRNTGISATVAGMIVAVVGLLGGTAAADQGGNAPQLCTSALQGSPDADLVISTTPAAGDTVAVGDEIAVALTWGTAEGNDIWASIDQAVVCMTVDGTLDEGSIYFEKPGVDDGIIEHTFVVPVGAEEVCVSGRVSGTPGPDNTTDSTHKSEQVCFPVGLPVEPCEFDETLPADDPACVEPEGEVCQFNANLPANDPACVAPNVVPRVDPPVVAGAQVTKPAPQAQVAGAALPRTGQDMAPMTAAGAGLVLLGAALLLARKPEAV